MTWHQRLQTLRRLPWRERGLLLEAFVLLGAARLAILLVPFHRLAGHLGRLHAETPAEVSPVELAQARRIGWAVVRAACVTPWVSNCFPQALAARLMLRRRAIAATLYLGVALSGSSDQRTMEAHAWLRCGSLIITGGPGHERYTITARFG